ncbi:SDR family oxidoreductase [Reinekea thalattae]|uniref:SDR family oxidoreductase n=1 Tax=Reinekea thalattae TaxID=2593301 RepID=A0A5C8ZCQ5_9GAMM|nr:SDR family oxidoreductase [Reinekea thalattae]TXR54630.1 SDR family oxidoreductase [Reinekea thalattae]
METVLITGASRGIGLELTRQFLQQGYQVIATYRNQPSDALSELATNQQLVLKELEVTDQSAIKALSAQLAGQTIDILINNAGTIGADDQSLEGIEASAWLDAFAINSIAPLMVTRALLSQIEQSENPRIITISSQMGSMQRDSVGMYAYRSSKAAVNKVVTVLANELKAKGVVACVVHPGWVKTDMGGENADITAQESATGLLALAQKLSLNDTGRFFTWQGDEHPW